MRRFASIRMASITVLLFAGWLVVANWVEKRTPSDSTILAQHSPRGPGRSNILMSQTGGAADTSATTRGTVIHELTHYLTFAGILDRDVPFAAAVGYYEEWLFSGKLQGHSIQQAFDRGLRDRKSEETVEELRSRYPRGTTESARSYLDGAVLAGITARLFSKSDEGVRYLYALAMDLNYRDALAVVRSDSAFGIVMDLRRGAFTSIDQSALDERLAQVDSSSAAIVRRYVNLLRSHYRLAFSPEKEPFTYAFALSADQYIAQALEHQKNGKIESAMADFDSAILADPQNPNGYFLRGYLYAATGNYPSAIEDMNAAIRLDSNEPLYYGTRGGLKHNVNDNLGALRDLRHAIAMDNSNPEFHNHLGITHLDMNEPDSALAHTAIAISLDEDYAEAYLIQGLSYKKKRQMDRAEASLNVVLRIAQDRHVHASILSTAQGALSELGQ